jgi:hypothetical protein
MNDVSLSRWILTDNPSMPVTGGRGDLSERRSIAYLKGELRSCTVVGENSGCRQLIAVSAQQSLEKRRELESCSLRWNPRDPFLDASVSALF